jgi:F-type H+-transporting ATPase subunit b
MIELPNVTSLYVLLAFGVSYFILKRSLFRPLSDILEAREREEREAQAAYAESLQTLEKAVAAGEQKLTTARREALKTREDLRGEGAALLEQKLAEARSRANEEISRGSREIEAQAAESARQLPEKARSLARELAEKILGRKLAA